MPEYMTLGSKAFAAARLRRTGGRLSYDDSLIPPGTEVKLAGLYGGAASLLVPTSIGTQLVPVYVSDVTTATFELLEVNQPGDYALECATLDHQNMPGEPIPFVGGATWLRTDRPLDSSNHHLVPRGVAITFMNINGKYVWAKAGDTLISFPKRYLTDAYFVAVG